MLTYYQSSIYHQNYHHPLFLILYFIIISGALDFIKGTEWILGGY